VEIGFDTVVVPDFAGPRARMFEARMLLFLGSWLENAGAARAYPLHVACIGEAPASVRAMAGRCKQAVLTVHEPLRVNEGPYANKLRGLEVTGHTPSVLLLDADIVVLADPSELGRLGRVIAVAHGKALKIPEAPWTRMFAARGVEPPTHRVVDGLGRSRQPYYNGGVVYLPRDCGLRESWEQDMRAIAELFPASDPFAAKARRTDQFGLAVALERLRCQGTPVVLLPGGYNVLWPHLWQGLATPAEVTVFHAMHVFSRDLGRLPFRHQLRYSRAASFRLSLRKMRWARAAGQRLRNPARSLWYVYEMGVRIQRIWNRQVEPVLREGG
jgi:hypothetical protein